MKDSEIAAPMSSSQIPDWKWKHMPSCSTVVSPGRRLTVRSPQSGG